MVEAFAAAVGGILQTAEAAFRSFESSVEKQRQQQINARASTTSEKKKTHGSDDSYFPLGAREQEKGKQPEDFSKSLTFPTLLNAQRTLAQPARVLLFMRALVARVLPARARTSCG